jgi:hypothetical protein
MMLKRGTRVWRASDGRPGRIIRRHANGPFGIVYRIRWWTRTEHGELEQHTCGKTYEDLIHPQGNWLLWRRGEHD